MRWSHNFAYGVGLIASDGNLSKDGRHINLTSKDIDQIQNFARIFKLKSKIGIKNSGFNSSKKYFYIQFSNVKLYRTLLNIRLTPNKSRTMGALNVPSKYFADFLRGYLDGDGYTYSYWDKRWKNSFRLYLGFVSASKVYLEWLKSQIYKLYNIEGNLETVPRAFDLVFAKIDSIILLRKMYYNDRVLCLKRKRFKIQQALSIIDQSRGGEIGRLLSLRC